MTQESHRWQVLLVKEVTGNIGWRKTLAVTPIVQETFFEGINSLSFSIWQEKEESETITGTTGKSLSFGLKPVTRVGSE